MSVTLRKRPVIISILGVIGFIFSAGQIIAISAPGIRDVAGWYPIVYGSIIALRFISLVGVWHMKKWGAELFAYITITKITIQILVGDFGLGAMIDTFFSVIFSIVFISFYRRMGRDL
ncbi:MAG: hypothetical protein M3R17_15765 [Bacteroidota bacterium]|nr:hypothetical protein [Bacteroidota bacterium]